MKKHTAVFISLILLFSTILYGCSGSKQDEKKSDKTNSKNTIKLATFYSEKEQGSVYKQIAESFEKTSNIKVEITYDYGDDTKIKESVSEKGDFDIIGLKRNQIIEFAKSGQLNDLSDMISNNKLEDKLYKICLSYGKYTGKTYGIGDMPQTIEWFYNSDMFDKYGLSEPKNLSELSALCKKIKSKGINPIGVGGMDGWNLSVLLSMISAQTAGSSDLTSCYGSDSKTYQNLNGIKDAFTVFGKFNSTCIASNSTDVNYRQSVDDFVKGKCAILPTGSWATDLIEQTRSAGFHYKSFKSSVNFTDNPVTQFSATAGQILSVPTNSKNKEDAIKFLEYFFSEEAQKVTADKGYSSPLISANKNETTVKELIASHLEMTDDNSILMYDNLPSEMAENTSRILQDIVEGNAKAQDGWNKIIKLTFQK